MLVGILLTALFVALNGFFVAAEFALVKLRATQIERLAKQKTARARAAVEVCSRLDRYLSATQLGITLASLGLGSVAEPRVAAALDAFAHRAGLAHLGLDRVAHPLAFAGLTAAHILLGELLPKLISIRAAEPVALNVARPLKFFYLLAFPALGLLNASSNLLLRAMGLPSLHDAEGALSEEEILGILSQAYAHGEGAAGKKLLLERVVAFSSRSARQVMVPRVDVVSLDADLAVEQALERIRGEQFTRYPVVEKGDLDRVVGYVNARDLFLPRERPAALRSVLRAAVLVPETCELFDLMLQMQRKQVPMAIVVDEYGGTSGICTLEDVLEEIVGEIRDEHDKDEVARAQRQADGTVSADGLATLNDLRGAGVDLEELPSATIGGAVHDALGRLARPGDQLQLGGWMVRVEQVRRRRVARVLMKREALAEGAEKSA